MAAPQEAPSDNTGKPNAAAELNFDFGFDTEEFSDSVLKLQFENGEEDEQEACQPVGRRRSKRRLETGTDDEGREESTRSIAPPSREIKVNSIVLAARSDFFRTMLQSGMREGCRDKPPIVLNVLKEGEAIIES